MRKDDKDMIEKIEGSGSAPAEKRKQPDVPPRSGPGSSSKRTKSKSTDRKRATQDIDPSHSSETASQPSTETCCSSISKDSSNSSEASKKCKEAPKKPREPSKCPYCSVVMTRTNDLRKHVEKLHQGPQEMLCHICHFRGTDIVTYLDHENDHLCKCPHCGYMAKNYRGLPRHKAFCRMNPEYEGTRSSSKGLRRESKEKRVKM